MNICEQCDESIKTLDVLHFDAGVCTKCGSLRDVVDPYLVGLYKGIGLAPDLVFDHLPRLRISPTRNLSIEEIDAYILKLFLPTTSWHGFISLNGTAEANGSVTRSLLHSIFYDGLYRFLRASRKSGLTHVITSNLGEKSYAAWCNSVAELLFPMISKDISVGWLKSIQPLLWTPHELKRYMGGQVWQSCGFSDDSETHNNLKMQLKELQVKYEDIEWENRLLKEKVSPVVTLFAGIRDIFLRVFGSNIKPSLSATNDLFSSRKINDRSSS